MKDKRKIIYGLIDPRNGQLKYIGKSGTGINRPKQHVKPSELIRDTSKVRWIKELLYNNIKPEIIIIEECQSHDELNESEDFWIEYFKYIGANLTNSCWGGKGTPGFKHSKETRKKLSELAKKRDKIRILETAMKMRKPYIIIDGIDHKKCSKCCIIKPLSEIVKSKAEGTGYTPYCKQCYINYNKIYREKNPPKLLTKEELNNSYKLRGKKISESFSQDIKEKFIHSCEKKVYIQNIKSSEIQIFTSLSNFTRSINGSPGGASLAIKNNRPYKGYILKYIDK